MAFYRTLLAIAGAPTDDGRTFTNVSWRSLPLPLAFQTDTQHAAFPTSEQVGQIVAIDPPTADGEVWATIEVDPRDDNGRAIHPEGARAAQMIEQGGQGISIDGLVPVDAQITEECVQEDEDGWCMMAVVTFSEVVIGGATLTPIPAFSQTIVDPTPVDANGAPLEEAEPMPMGLVASAAVAPVPSLLASAGYALTAAAAVGFADWELRPEHFERPVLSGEANYINVDDDGRVWGWIAAAERCHQSFPDRCVLAADQSPDLSDFLRNFLSVGGERVPVGFLTMDTSHASTTPDTSTAQVAAHYDDTRNIAAIVTAGIVPDGEHSAGSIWFSGSVSPRLDAWQRTVLAAGQASGDWRADPGQRDRTLRAALVVPVPGFLRNREPVLATGSPTAGCGCGGERAPEPAQAPLTAAQTAALARLADEHLDAELAALDEQVVFAELPPRL